MKKFFTYKIVLFLTALVLVAAAVVPSVYFYRQYAAMKKEVAAQTKSEDPKALIARVARHILLPAGEEPTVMTVTDKEKLSGQVFFINAKNGDKVLIYEKAKKAFLYDPIADIVIEVGPIILAASPSATLAPAGSSPATAATPSATIPVLRLYTFAVLNATQTKGLAETYAAKLIVQVPGARVVTRGNAKGNYAASLLIDVSGTHKDETSALAQTLGLEVSPLPAGEATSSADFLIILGTDQK
jgi:hypothetical protein